MVREFFCLKKIYSKKRIPLIVTIILFTCSCNDDSGNNPASIEFEVKLDKSTSSDSSKETSVMLLGIYHFSNPGHDTYHMEIDDYYSDGRQEEIREVVGILEQYKPK